jgi:hypothetical protein
VLWRAAVHGEVIFNDIQELEPTAVEAKDHLLALHAAKEAEGSVCHLSITQLRNMSLSTETHTLSQRKILRWDEDGQSTSHSQLIPL